MGRGVGLARVGSARRGCHLWFYWGMRRLILPAASLSCSLLASACLLDRELYEERRAELLSAGAGGGEGGAEDPGDDGSDPAIDDEDGDGYAADDDCDDTDPTVHPGAPEGWLDDGIDNDCDGDAWAAITWGQGDAAATVLGTQAGVELGRRLAYWEAGDCLLTTAPFFNENRGRVFGIPGGVDGDVGAEGVGYWEGATPYTYLGNPITPREDGSTIVMAPSGAEGAGEAWLLDAADICAGGRQTLSSGPRITGAAVGDYLGASATWLPDLDGDGLEELVVVSSFAAAGGTERGAAYLFREPTRIDADTVAADADVVVAGGHDGASLAEVHVAWRRAGGSEPVLLFTQDGDPAGGHAVLRVEADDLRSGRVDDLATGALVSYADRWVTLAVVGDVSRDGTDEFIGGVWTYGVWSVDDIVGTMEEDEAVASLEWGGEDDWITQFTPIGDGDGDSVADLVVQAEDWPAGEEQGRFALLSGADLPPTGVLAVGGRRLQAEGAALGDSFGYRIAPAGDTDGDGRRDLAVSAYGHDGGETNAGAIFYVPLPY